MKKIILLTVIMIGLGTILSAGEIDDAYQKEYAFLKAQKNELQRRLSSEKAQQTRELSKQSAKLQSLQSHLLSLTSQIDANNELLTKLNAKLGDSTDNSEILGNLISQVQMSLDPYGVKIDDNNKTADITKLQQAFSASQKLFTSLSSKSVEKGKFYLPNGTAVDGDIVKIGNIAAYGISKSAAGALAPAGNGEYKLWNAVGSSDDAKALMSGKKVDPLDIFIYENLDKDIEYTKKKTLDDVLKAGGVIGYIILGLGAFGLLLLLIRFFILLRANSNVDKITKIVVNKLKSENSQSALDAIKNYSGSTARVIKSVLRNIGKQRDYIEDIVTENILNESSSIDKFGAFVLVIAAVAPLLGLLGTVTGMIHTFDIITEFGTGDPKLLSGGISEALVTTEFGLIVAIPLLLLGNLLSGWSERIKDSMEQNALHIINVYEKNRAR